MTRDEVRELAALDALGLLIESERLRLREALVADPALAGDHSADRALVARLASEMARTPLPAPLYDRTLAAIAAARPASAVSLASRRRRPLVVAATFAAAAAAAVVLVVARSRDHQPIARAALAAGPAHGAAELRAGGGGTIVVRLDGLKPAPAGHHYELWLLPAGESQMSAVARLTPSAGHVEARFKLPAAGTYAAVDVSLEPDDAPTTQPHQSIMQAAFSPA